MGELVRFGVSIEDELLEKFDQLISARGYATRSESLRDLIRDALVQARLESRSTEPDQEVVGSLTFVYDHHARNLATQMAEKQHANHDIVVSVTHVHIDHHDCMEVLLLRGSVSRVRALADSILNLKGIKHGKLFVTFPSHSIEKHHHHSHSHKAS